MKQSCVSREWIRGGSLLLIQLLGSLKLFCCKIKLVLSGRKKVGLEFLFMIDYFGGFSL
jgi:hypothetical protein